MSWILVVAGAAIGGGGGAILANNMPGGKVDSGDKWKYILGGALGGGTLGAGASIFAGGAAATGGGIGTVGGGLAAEGTGLGLAGGAEAGAAGLGGAGLMSGSTPLTSAFLGQQAAQYGAMGVPTAFGSGMYGLGAGGGAGLGATYLGGQAATEGAKSSLMSSFLKNTASSIASQKAMDTMKGNYQSQTPIMEKDFRNTLMQYKQQEEEKNKLPPYYFTYPNMQQPNYYGGF